MPKEINGLFTRIYENFFMRDLTYIFGGNILLATTYHALGKNLLCAIKYVTQNFFTFLILILVTYFIGLIVQQGVSCIPFINKIFITEPDIPKPYKTYTVFRALLSKRFEGHDIREIERVIYLKQVSFTVGSSYLISALISLYPLIKNHKISDFIISGVLIILTFVCYKENRVQSKIENDAYKEFAERMNGNKSSIQEASGGPEASRK